MMEANVMINYKWDQIKLFTSDTLNAATVPGQTIGQEDTCHRGSLTENYRQHTMTHFNDQFTIASCRQVEMQT